MKNRLSWLGVLAVVCGALNSNVNASEARSEFIQCKSFHEFSKTIKIYYSADIFMDFTTLMNFETAKSGSVIVLLTQDIQESSKQSVSGRGVFEATLNFDKVDEKKFDFTIRGNATVASGETTVASILLKSVAGKITASLRLPEQGANGKDINLALKCTSLIQ